MPRRGKGMRFEMQMKGGDKLAAKLRGMGKDAERVVDEATRSALDVAAGPIRQDAPGPGIVMVKSEKPNKPGVLAYEVGPDKAHWYYQFFETGVQPFEINLVKGRTKRSATNRKASAQKGKTVAMSGRRVRGEKQAVKFAGPGGVVFAKRIRRGPMAARPFMRKNFLGNTDRMQDEFGKVIKGAAIAPRLEG